MNKDFLDHLNFLVVFLKILMKCKSGFFPRSVGIYIQNGIAQSSQNVLELLRKVDQSRDRSVACSVQFFREESII